MKLKSIALFLGTLIFKVIDNVIIISISPGVICMTFEFVLRNS